ncbi:hypothetical protein DYBT9275_02245 [Dyadobacter sp. CECT 9275]|uniref:Uncharacterized protein n=2 Tax=Dyadobacter helix TaxID=2822344 RepID=A0A916JBS3_9BACT|nr:hypothetical protein DYBT9275_02245 [Dyadobacter sp. CECT 9275]
METAGPEITGPEPPPPAVKLLSRDSITTGTYRGIAINSTDDATFAILEDYRQKGVASYQGAVHNYFADVSDLKERLPFFDYLTLDEQTDTDSGVQISLVAGRVTEIALNNRTALKQWPQTSDSTEAIRIGDEGEVLYNKLVALSTQSAFAPKFQRITLLAKYSYAIYDPAKASLPWNITFQVEPDISEAATVHFKKKKVQYIIVNRFQRL